MVRESSAVVQRSLRSPLGKRARRARLALLLMSGLSLIATQTGLVPTAALAPHPPLQLHNYMTLLKFVLFFNVVLLITFTTCSLVDYLNWRLYGAPAAPPQPAAEKFLPGRPGRPAPRNLPPAIRLRLLLNLALPCLLALYAIGAALRIMYLHYVTFSLHP